MELIQKPIKNRSLNSSLKIKTDLVLNNKPQLTRKYSEKISRNSLINSLTKSLNQNQIKDISVDKIFDFEASDGTKKLNSSSSNLNNNAACKDLTDQDKAILIIKNDLKKKIYSSTTTDCSSDDQSHDDNDYDDIVDRSLIESELTRHFKLKTNSLKAKNSNPNKSNKYITYKQKLNENKKLILGASSFIAPLQNTNTSSTTTSKNSTAQSASSHTSSTTTTTTTTTTISPQTGSCLVENENRNSETREKSYKPHTHTRQHHYYQIIKNSDVGESNDDPDSFSVPKFFVADALDKSSSASNSHSESSNGGRSKSNTKPSSNSKKENYELLEPLLTDHKEEDEKPAANDNESLRINLNLSLNKLCEEAKANKSLENLCSKSKKRDETQTTNANSFTAPAASNSTSSHDQSNKYGLNVLNNLKAINLNIINNNNPSSSLNVTSNNLNTNKSNCNSNGKSAQRYKLLLEGDVQICKLPYSSNVISKILNSKFLRRWKTHRIILTDTEIYSTTKTDYMDSNIPYHTIIEVSPISKWEPGQRYYLRIATIECHYLVQTNNVYIRDQWVHSLIWKKHKFKSERVLLNATRPEVLLKEIRNAIAVSLTMPIDDSEIYHFPLELISEILQKHQFPKQTHEEVIVCLGPLLEKNHPSPEICDFFSRHCRDSPRSHIVIEMFTPVVRRILKHNDDFGRYLRMRLFIQDYFMALMSQNTGLETVQNFVKQMHVSSISDCPFPRVLPNIFAVCLAAIHGCFEQRTNYKTQPISAVKLAEHEKDAQLICHTTMLFTMSKFDDWRVSLSQLLQSVPFPDQALAHDKFISIFKKVVEKIAQDARCEVHQTLLGIREEKEGWFEIFCPGGFSCDDDGQLFGTMLQTLIGCCCKKKRFLLSINKLLPQILVLAVRQVPSAIETLCAMLDLDGVENPESKVKIVCALQSNELGKKAYAIVCEKQMKLRELQQKGGPRKLTLPSRSTDQDLAKLFLSGSFGNLECLSLAFTNVTSACAQYLIKLPSLRYLNLWSTKFGDDGLELISEHLSHLQVLNLCETPVTDKGLACLASMKQLRKLNLNSTNLSALTFESLKESLPALQECDIRYTDAW